MNILLDILSFLKKNWKEVLFVVLLLLLLFFSYQYFSQKEEIRRLEGNFYAMSDSTEYFKTQSGLNAAKTKNAELTLNEFKSTTNKEIVHLKETIDDLNIKLKKISGASTGTTEIYIKDTVLLHDTVYNGKLSKSGVYKDPWTSLSFFVSEDTVEFDLSTKDTIDIITSQEKVGKFRLRNIFVKRPVVYTTIATMTRPTGKIEVNSFVIKK